MEAPGPWFYWKPAVLAVNQPAVTPGPATRRTLRWQPDSGQGSLSGSPVTIGALALDARAKLASALPVRTPAAGIGASVTVRQPEAAT